MDIQETLATFQREFEDYGFGATQELLDALEFMLEDCPETNLLRAMSDALHSTALKIED